MSPPGDSSPTNCARPSRVRLAFSPSDRVSVNPLSGRTPRAHDHNFRQDSRHDTLPLTVRAPMKRDTTIGDCERVQAAWLSARAIAGGGAVWHDGEFTWSTGPDGQSLLFPNAVDRVALARGVDRARSSTVRVVGAWLGAEVDAGPLAEAGFVRGWSPWWMAAEISAVGRPGASRIELQRTSDDYHDENSGYTDLLSLARRHPTRAWYAAAYTSGTHRFAGRSWSFLDGETAGIFDLAVWPNFRRQGFGSDLLRTVTREASRSGAREVVLNATPEGMLLYERRGFRTIGEGATWWLRLPVPSVGVEPTLKRF